MDDEDNDNAAGGGALPVFCAFLPVVVLKVMDDEVRPRFTPAFAFSGLCNARDPFFLLRLPSLVTTSSSPPPPCLLLALLTFPLGIGVTSSSDELDESSDLMTRRREGCFFSTGMVMGGACG